MVLSQIMLKVGWQVAELMDTSWEVRQILDRGQGTAAHAVVFSEWRAAEYRDFKERICLRIENIWFYEIIWAHLRIFWPIDTLKLVLTINNSLFKTEHDGQWRWWISIKSCVLVFVRHKCEGLTVWGKPFPKRRLLRIKRYPPSTLKPPPSLCCSWFTSLFRCWCMSDVWQGKLQQNPAYMPKYILQALL